MNEQTANTFSLRQARDHAGLTQREVAKGLGIDRSTYIKIEHDPNRATVAQIKKLSEITGIPMASLFLS